MHILSITGNQGTFTKNIEQVVTDVEIWYHIGYLVFCVSGLFLHPFFYCVLVSSVHIRSEYRLLMNGVNVSMVCNAQLFDVVYREETLVNVINSVTKNWRSIMLTAVLALILVYMFSIVGYLFFKDDFLMNVDEEVIRKY